MLVFKLENPPEGWRDTDSRSNVSAGLSGTQAYALLTARWEGPLRSAALQWLRSPPNRTSHVLSENKTETGLLLLNHRLPLGLENRAIPNGMESWVCLSCCPRTVVTPVRPLEGTMTSQGDTLPGASMCVKQTVCNENTRFPGQLSGTGFVLCSMAGDQALLQRRLF